MFQIKRYQSPLGLLRIVSDGEAIVALTMDGQCYEERHLPQLAIETDTPLLSLTAMLLDAYFSGRRPDFSVLPLRPEGTQFQLRVWHELTQIPYGSTLSYSELARRLHSSPRAVGAAVGKNPISILVPCHRVLGADGSLVGYAGGISRKAALLRLEKTSFCG